MSSKAVKRNTSQKKDTPSKRVRISDDVVNHTDQSFEAQVLEDLESRPTSKKVVKNEGYDSDSSDDGEGVVRSRKSGSKANADDEEDDDDDMFAPSTSAQKDDSAPSKKKKDPKYLALGDIEGQEFGGDGSDDSDLDEPEDEDDAERRKKKGMGYEISSFNMKAELEEGRMADDGTFVRSVDPHAMHDKWMDGLDEREIKRAKKSKKLIEEKEQARMDAVQEEQNRGKEDLIKELLGYLDRGETTLEALQRLGKGVKKPSNLTAAGKSKGKAPTKDAQAMDTDSTNTRPPSAIERVTTLASCLMSLGMLDVYEESYDSLLRTVRRAGIIPDDWAPPILHPTENSKIYEYRWDPILAGEVDTTKTFGPFSKVEILQWRDALYFGAAGDRIQLRRIGDTGWGNYSILL